MTSVRGNFSREQCSEEPAGFGLYRTRAAHEIPNGIEILLPLDVRSRLLEARRTLAIAREKALEQERERAQQLAATTSSARPMPHDEREFVKRFERGVARRNPAHRHPVLRASEIVRVVARISTTRNKDDHKRELELVERLKALGALREVVNPAFQPERWAMALASLRAVHPHFADATDFVADHVSLSKRSVGPLVIPPIHVWGPPGIGKSHYASDLAAALGAPLRRHSMENAQTTALLLGTERHWSTATPGIVFEQIVLGSSANPVFLIDEIDKAPRNAGYDPLAPLHSLMEPLTAATARDASLDITFDASLAIFITASNDPRKIPDSLRSRMTEFQISPPRGEAALQIARIVANRAVEQLSIPGFDSPAPRIAHKLAHLSPRAIRKATQLAVAHALANDRRYLVASDLPLDELDERQPLPTSH